MRRPTRDDVTLILFRQVVGTRLNLALGTDSGCISDTLAAADRWLAVHPPGSGLRARSPAWRNEGEAYKDELDAYNDGRLCAPPR